VVGDGANYPVRSCSHHAQAGGKGHDEHRGDTCPFGVGIAIVVFFICLYYLAVGQLGWGVVAAVTAGLLAVTGFGWLRRERRRVRPVEARYVAGHPDEDFWLMAKAISLQRNS
jgi:hypothetical protein